VIAITVVPLRREYVAPVAGDHANVIDEAVAETASHMPVRIGADKVTAIEVQHQTVVVHAFNDEETESLKATTNTFARSDTTLALHFVFRPLIRKTASFVFLARRQ
jgi:hypothetical protein